MAIQSYSAAGLEALFNQFYEDFKKQNTDFFVQKTVFVENPVIGKWLKLKMADRGIFFNTKITYLESGIASLLDHEFKKKLLDIQGQDDFLLQFYLYEILIENSGNDLLKPYQNNPTGTWNLAGKLFELFRNYEYKNPAMLAGWTENRLEDPESEIEKNQHILYIQWLAKIRKNHNPSADQLKTWPQLLFEDSQAIKLSSQIPIYLFGFSYLSYFHENLLHKISANQEIYFYRFPAHGKYPGLLKTANSLEKTFTGNSALPQLQAAIASKDSLAEKINVNDHSFQIAACPGHFREVETVHQAILWDMENTPGLKWNEIAVLCGDMQTYKPVIDAIFQREPEIPYVIADKTAGVDSLAAQAIEDLICLLTGDVTRKETFQLIFSPFFLPDARITRKDKEKWLEWAHNYGVFRDTDSGNRSMRKFGWKQGMSRYRLARLMDCAELQSPVFEDLMLMGESVFDGESGIETFLIAMEKILLVKDEINLQPSLKNFAQLLLPLLKDMIRIPSDSKEEQRVYQDFIDFLHFISFLEKKNQVKFNFTDINLIVEVFETQIKKIKLISGKILTKGVTIGKIERMAGIPFRHIYFLGINEGVYPSVPTPDPLDLLENNKGKINSLIPLAELQIQYFKTAVLSAADKICMTYNNLQLEEDKEIYPSCLIFEIEKYLKEFKPVKIPLFEKDLFLDAQKAPSFTFYDKPEMKKILMESFIQSQNQEEEFLKKAPAPVKQINVKDLKEFLLNPVLSYMKKRLGLYNDEGEDLSLKEDEPFMSGGVSEIGFKNSILKELLLEKANEAVQKTDSEYKKQQAMSRFPEGVYGNLEIKKITAEIESQLKLMEILKTVPGKFCPEIIIGQTKQKNPEAGNICTDAPIIQIKGNDLKLEGSLENIWIKGDTITAAVISQSGVSNIIKKYYLEPLLFFSALTLTEQFRQIKNLRIIVCYKNGIAQMTCSADEKMQQFLRDLIGDFLDSSQCNDFIDFDTVIGTYKENSFNEKLLEEKIKEALQGEEGFSLYKKNEIELLKLAVHRNLAKGPSQLQDLLARRYQFLVAQTIESQQKGEE